MLEWTQEYVTGIKELDEQRRKMFDYINQLERLIQDGVYAGPEIARIIGYLGAHMRIHFDFEEDYAKVHRCPGALENRAAHEYFMQIFRAFEDEYAKAESSFEYLTRLHTTTESWWANHIVTLDAQLCEAMEQS